MNYHLPSRVFNVYREPVRSGVHLPLRLPVAPQGIQPDPPGVRLQLSSL